MSASAFFTHFAPAPVAPPPHADSVPELRRDPVPRVVHICTTERDHTVAELLDLYEREYLPHLSPRTQHSAKLLYVRWRKDMGHVLLRDLTPAFLRQWRDELRAKYAPATVNRYLASLASPLTVAVRDYEWLPTNPLHKVQKAPEPSGRVRFLSDEERERLLAVCDVSRNPHLSLLVLLAITTGARRNEMLQLRWHDVDVEQGLLRFMQTKNKERRSVPVRGEALTLLRRQRSDHPPEAWVFPRADRRGPTFFEQAWQTAKRKAGLENFRFHDLRHTAASYLALSGATLFEISVILGHRNIKQTSKYAHLTTGHSGEVIERMVKHRLGAQEESLYADTRR